MKILIFSGAGTSIELGVPGMTGLADSFLTHVREWKVQPEVVERLMGVDRDLEDLIERVDQICDAEESLDSLGVDMSAVGPRVAAIRREVEWYVQHVAERVVPRDAHLMWSPVLGCAGRHELVLVTTNYDRAIEVAAKVEDIALDDGFGEPEEGETTPWIGFERTESGVRLIKLHGSTDWYRDQGTRQAFKLRHPMPLFAGGTLVFGDCELGAAVVLPSREKILTREPYPRLSQEFLDAGDSAEIVMCVGSSLRDPHIRQAVEGWAEKKSVFLVTPDRELPPARGAKVIHETASEFLISTLPDALTSDGLVSKLERRSDSDGDDGGGWQPDVSDGIFQVVQAALDEGIHARQRCEAVGELVDRGATLPVEWVKRLISDGDPALARHALGLIMGASQYEELIRMARDSPHMGDRAFHDEYGMLQQHMVEQRNLEEHRSGDE